MENENEQEICQCPVCKKREEEIVEAEGLNLAILLALMPALTITFLSNAGFF
jgi:hypothetical protein